MYVQPSPSPAATPTAEIQHFEGDTALSAYTKSTNEHLQRAFRENELLQHTPELATALSSLHQIVSTQDPHSKEHSNSIGERNERNAQKYEIPPAEIVSMVLRECKDIYDTVVRLFYPVRPYNETVALCKELYFNINGISNANLIVTFGGLYLVFRYYEFAFRKSPQEDTFHQYTTAFARNLMDLISRLPVLMESTIDNFEALLLGVSSDRVRVHALAMDPYITPGVLRCGKV
jgi:hypothetical protein